MPDDVTMYADGVRRIEVVRIPSHPGAQVERTILEPEPGGAPDPTSFTIYAGDILMVRRLD